MPKFNWDDKDPLEGFDTEPEPEPVPPKADVKTPSIPGPFKRPTAPAVLKPHVAVEEVVDDIEESAGVDPDSLSEAEWRLEKAQYYRAVINSQLLSSDHPAAVEVETELQQWAKDQMEVLLGIRQTTPGRPTLTLESMDEFKAEVLATLKGNLQFTEEEAEVLKAVAARVLSKQGSNVISTPQPPQKPQEPPKPVSPAVKPVAAKPAASVTPARTNDKPRAMGRGRPRKNPCSICGQMECGHKSNQTKIPEGSQVVKTPEAETFQGVPIQIVDGKRIVDMPNGVRYRIDRRTVQYKDGTIKEEDVPFELSRPMTTPRAMPYPSEQEAINMAAVEAANAESKMQSNPIFSKLVKAAQAAPERETYVPQRPTK